MKEAYNLLLELRVDSMDFLLSRNYSSENDKIFQVYIKSLHDFISLTLNNDNNSYENYMKREKEYRRDLEKLTTDNKLLSFARAEIRLHASLIRLKYGDQFSGAIRLIQAYNIIKTEMDTESTPLYFYKTAGVLNIIMSIVPDKYKFFMKILGIRSDLSKGIYQLEQLNNPGNIFFIESHMINAFLNAYYLNDPDKAWKNIAIVHQIWAESRLYLYLKGLIAVKTRENEIAIESFRRCNTFNDRYLPLAYCDFYLAECHFKKMELSLAERIYSTYLDQAIVEDFVKASYYKLSLIYLLRYDFETAEHFRKKVVSEGLTSTEADKYANKMVMANNYPHPDLLKARFYFDGGYYRQSLDVLKSMVVDKLTEEELMEYYYRTGRVYQLLDEYDRALEYFEKTFNTNYPGHYLVANAHLESGYIKYRESKIDEAAYHFQIALKYTGELYQSSIRNEAKAGLNLIK